jgi:hypothetical protein
MEKIKLINVILKTANIKDAGTDGDVFLGIGGREFNLDNSYDDRKKGAKDDYQIGPLGQSKVNNPENNNTTSPQIQTEDIDKFPVYIRFEPHGSGPDWCLEYAKMWTVSVSPDQTEKEGRVYESKPTKLWLGTKHGKFVFLKKMGYDARIAAWTTAGWAVLPITMDGASTGFNTPHTFVDLKGTHKFTLPETAKGYTLTEWNKNAVIVATTQRTVTVTSDGVYTAQYTGKPTP